MGWHRLDTAIRQRLDEGESVAAIAGALNCMPRTVRRRQAHDEAALTMREAGQRGQRARYGDGDRWWAATGDDLDWVTVSRHLDELEERLLKEWP